MAYSTSASTLSAREAACNSHRLVDVFLDAGALFIESGERVLRFRIAGGRGEAKQLRRALEVLRQRLAVEIEQRQIIGRLRVAELGRGCQQLHGLLAVDGAAAPGKPQHCERKHAVAVA